MGMTKFGFWWKDTGSRIFFALDDFTKKEAEELLPQVIDAKPSNHRYGYLLVSLGLEQLFVYVSGSKSVTLPRSYRLKEIRTGIKEAISDFFPFETHS